MLGSLKPKELKDLKDQIHYLDGHKGPILVDINFQVRAEEEAMWVQYHLVQSTTKAPECPELSALEG